MLSESVLDSIPKAKTGLVNITVKGNGRTSQQVTFDNSFKSAPCVSVCFASAIGDNSGGAGFLANLAVSAHSVTATNFSIDVSYNGTPPANTINVRWVAIGY